MVLSSGAANASGLVSCVVHSAAGTGNTAFYDTILIPEIVANIFNCEPARNHNLRLHGKRPCVCKQWNAEHLRWRRVYFDAAAALCANNMPVFFNERNVVAILACLARYRYAGCVQRVGCGMLSDVASLCSQQNHNAHASEPDSYAFSVPSEDEVEHSTGGPLQDDIDTSDEHGSLDAAVAHRVFDAHLMCVEQMPASAQEVSVQDSTLSIHVGASVNMPTTALAGCTPLEHNYAQEEHGGEENLDRVDGVDSDSDMDSDSDLDSDSDSKDDSDANDSANSADDAIFEPHASESPCVVCVDVARRIVRNNGLRILVKTLQAHQHDTEILRTAVHTICILCVTSTAIELLVCIKNAVQIIVSTVRRLADDATILHEALILLIDVIESRSKCTKTAFLQAGGGACVLQILRLHPTDRTVQSLGVSVISYMASGRHTEQTESVVGCGGIAAYLQCMQRNMQHTNVMNVLMTGVANVAANAQNKSALFQGGAIRLILDTMQTHPCNTEVRYSCMSALAEIAWKYVRIWKHIEQQGGTYIMQSSMSAANLSFRDGVIVRDQ